MSLQLKQSIYRYIGNGLTLEEKGHFIDALTKIWWDVEYDGSKYDKNIKEYSQYKKFEKYINTLESSGFQK